MEIARWTRTTATSHLHAELRLLFMRPHQEGPAPVPASAASCQDAGSTRLHEEDGRTPAVPLSYRLRNAAGGFWNSGPCPARSRRYATQRRSARVDVRPAG